MTQQTIVVRHSTYIDKRSGDVNLQAARPIERKVTAFYSSGMLRDDCGEIWHYRKGDDGKLYSVGQVNPSWTNRQRYDIH